MAKAGALEFFASHFVVPSVQHDGHVRPRSRAPRGSHRRGGCPSMLRHRIGRARSSSSSTTCAWTSAAPPHAEAAAGPANSGRMVISVPDLIPGCSREELDAAVARLSQP